MRKISTRRVGVAAALAALTASGWTVVDGKYGRHRFWLATHGSHIRLVAVRATSHSAGRLFTRTDPEKLVPALVAVAATLGAEPWLVGVDVPVANVRWEPVSRYESKIRALRTAYVAASPSTRTAMGLLLGRRVANLRQAV